MTDPGRRRGAWGWGTGAGVLLVAGACVSVALGVLPGIPLFDSQPPPAAYRWVTPPPELRGINQRPAALSQDVALAASGSPETYLATADGQVQLHLPAATFPPAAGQSSVRVAMQPEPGQADPSPPPGVDVQGNIYRVTATYEPGGTPAAAAQPVDVTLRYPVDATQVALVTGTAWQLLATTPEPTAYALASSLPQLGDVVAVTVGVRQAPAARIPTWAYLAAGIALLLAAVPTLARRSRGTGAGP